MNYYKKKSGPRPAELDFPLRYDKNLAYNVQDFRIFGENANLAMDLMIYFAHQFQKGNNWMNPIIRLDMNDFCKVMGYDKASLLRKATNPKHIKTWNY